MTDWYNHRVQVFNSSHGYITEIRNNFNFPYDVAVNGSGHVFVADANNHRVQVFDPEYRNIHTITGFTSPLGVAINGTGHIFVGDARDRVWVFDSAFRQIASSTDPNTPNTCLLYTSPSPRD